MWLSCYICFENYDSSCHWAFSCSTPFITLAIFLLDKCWFQGNGRKMCSKNECVILMPPCIIPLIHQVRPLNGFDLYFCITSLLLLLPPLFVTLLFHYLSIILWPFLMLLISLAFFLFLLNRSPTISHSSFDIFSLFLYFYLLLFLTFYLDTL